MRATLRRASAETALARRDKLQAQHGHAEILVGIAGIFAAQLHQLVVRKAQRLAQRAQMLFDQFGVEAVVAGGHRRVRGKDHFAGNAGHGLIEADALVLHAAANRFQNGKSAVAFVQVQNAGRDAHGSQRAEAADAEQQFLADTDARIAAIQPRGEFAILGRVAFDVGIEQQQIAAPDLHAPDFRADGAAAGLDLHRDRLAVRSDRRFHGQLVDIGLEVFFLLPAGAIQALAEISLAVEQADADQRNVQIGRALDVIAGQHAQAAGIFRNGLVQAEFGGEIGHRTRPQNAGVPGSPGAVRVEIFALAAIGVVDAAVQHQFAGAAFHRRQRNFREQRNRDCD